MASSQTQKDKAEFFAGLDRLEDLDSDEDTRVKDIVQYGCPQVESDRVPLLKQQRSTTNSDSPTTRELKRRRIFGRATQIPRLATPGLKPSCPSPAPSSLREDIRCFPTGRKQARSQMPTARYIATKVGESKARKTPAKKGVPEAEQIFRGQVFYFIPNNDFNGSRKLRIKKALENGAERSTVLSWKVTHIIVDCGLCTADVQREIQDSVLQKGIIIVNDTWLTESIGFKEVRSPTATRFQVSIPKTAMANEMSPLRALRGHTTRQSSPARESSSDDEQDIQLHHQQAGSSGKTQEQLEPTSIEEFIEEARLTQDLPLDVEEETSPQSSFGETHDKTNKGFQCMEKHDGTRDAANPNTRTIEMLQKMASYYDRTGDRWRTLGYQRAITALRKQTTFIDTKEAALTIPQVGDRLAQKIEEIVVTDRLRRLESTQTDPSDQVLQLFMGIYDVGYSTASRWITQGWRTLDDLTSKATLTTNQKIGIEHYHDFQTRVPRAEVAEHAQTVEKALRSVDPNLQLIIGGSYRRGAADCGDIDMIITRKGASLERIRTLVMESVIPKLIKQGFLKAALATGSSHDSSSKWHGASALPGAQPWRRIDLLFVPWNELGAALIYFTGNDIFNRSLRLLASRKGMRLNQHGLYADVMRGPGRTRFTKGRLLEGQSEDRIFEILGVPYRSPEHRQC